MDELCPMHCVLFACCYGRMCLPRRTWRTNAFATARGDKMVMWPFAKLLWTVMLTAVILTYQYHYHVSVISVRQWMVVPCCTVLYQQCGGDVPYPAGRWC